MLAAFEAAQAAIAPVYTMRELLADPHVRARGVFVDVDGVMMTGPTARSRAPRAHPPRRAVPDDDTGTRGWNPR